MSFSPASALEVKFRTWTSLLNFHASTRGRRTGKQTAWHYRQGSRRGSRIGLRCRSRSWLRALSGNEAGGSGKKHVSASVLTAATPAEDIVTSRYCSIFNDLDDDMDDDCVMSSSPRLSITSLTRQGQTDHLQRKKRAWQGKR